MVNRAPDRLSGRFTQGLLHEPGERAGHCGRNRHFTSFAASRFVNREAVLQALRQAASRAGLECSSVRAIHLFGSYADGTPTPHSDADVLVVADEEADRRDVFDLFVQLQSEAEASRAAGRGLAAAALRHSLTLYPASAC